MPLGNQGPPDATGRSFSPGKGDISERRDGTPNDQIYGQGRVQVHSQCI